MSDVTEIQVRERLEEVNTLIEKHEVAIAYLRQEAMELNTAVRVFDRFHSRPDYGGLLPAHPPEREAEVKKPAGIPPMAEMIRTALEIQDVMTGGGLVPKDLVGVIRARWWPEAPSTSVGPIAWRMWKEGRLIKDGAAYCLPKDETPAVSPAGVSGLESPYDVEGL